METMLARFSSWLGTRSFLRAERSGRIDESTAFFQVGPSVWRWVEAGRCLHFYCDVAGATIHIDLNPLGPWSGAIHSAFTTAMVLPGEAPTLGDDEKSAILRKLRKLAWVREVAALDPRRGMG